MALATTWAKAVKALGRPSKQNLSRLSWALTFAIAGKWIYDSERDNPTWFSEAPTLTGTAQARDFAPEDMEKWNSAIAPKDEQLTWKAEKASQK
mmetsp:Transcript_35210/g.109636  ORF Transcript_35210/g.109636 Transcript_35210/m.109636 type:complete len:94 (+) Transcript_35210:37-318(+)